MNDLTTTRTSNAMPVRGSGMSGLMADMLNDPIRFEHVCRVAKIYAHSPLFPEHLRKGGAEVAIANAVLVMNMASRLSEDPITIASNIYFVGGKPGWSASYMISKANQHGVFRNPIDWEITGKGENLSVTAYGLLKSTGKRVEVTMSMDTAKKEGWTSNKKYQSMPEQMLRYRSATALIRLYCPEVMVGIPSEVEIEVRDDGQTMRDVTPREDAMASIMGEEAKPAKATDATKTEAYDPETGEVTETAPKKVNREKPAPAPKKEDPAPEEPVTEAEQEQVAPEADQETEAQGISDGGDDRQDPAQSGEPSAKAINLRNSILKDIAASGAPDAVESFYTEQLAKLQVEAPGLHAELMEAFEAARA